MGNGLRILLLAPQPFYQDRGTPIAVGLLVKVLSDRGDRVDILTYHEGEDVEHDHVCIHRIPTIPFVRNIKPGFSWKKVLCNAVMCFKAIQLVSKNRYQLVHAVEESVFMALMLKWVFSIPYVYDMDSSLSDQMVERFPLLGAMRPVLTFCERVAVRNAKVVVPVCDALAGIARKYEPERMVVLRDVSLLKETESLERTRGAFRPRP